MKRDGRDKPEPLKEKSRAGLITVADIDPLMPRYHVLTERGRELGEKIKGFGYVKPRYDSRGRRIGGKRDSLDLRKYKSAPPWLKLQITEIRNSGYDLEVYVKEVES